MGRMGLSSSTPKLHRSALVTLLALSSSTVPARAGTTPSAFLPPGTLDLFSAEFFTSEGQQEQASGAAGTGPRPRAKISVEPRLPRFMTAAGKEEEGEEMKKRVLVPIADGSEEIETTCITDTLTRFGAEVTVATVMDREGDLICTMSRGIRMAADITIDVAAKEQWDMIVLPGGMPGAEHLRDCKTLTKLLKDQKRRNKFYGAICAAPAVALATNGLIPDDVHATCYPAPAFREKLKNVSEANVVVSDNLATSQGPGTALQFSLQLGELLFGKVKRDRIAEQMLVGK